MHKRVDPSYTIGFDPAAGAKKKDLYPEVGPTGRCDTLGEATLQDSIPRGGGGGPTGGFDSVWRATPKKSIPREDNRIFRGGPRQFIDFEFENFADLNLSLKLL